MLKNENGKEKKRKTLNLVTLLLTNISFIGSTLGNNFYTCLPKELIKFGKFISTNRILLKIQYFPSQNVGLWENKKRKRKKKKVEFF